MAYDNVPEENAPALPPQRYEYDVDPDKMTIDDLDMFDSSAATGNRQMLDFLDRVVADVKIDGQSTGPGVRGKAIPYPKLKDIFEAVGATMKDAQTKN